MTTLTYILIGMAVVIAAIIAKTRFADFPAQAPEDYEGGPIFNIKDVLNGPIKCEGAIYGPTGRVTSTFEADFNATWNGDHGRMVETFHYSDGSTVDREWLLTLHNDGRIDATAADVVGVGSGMQEGSAVQLRYKFKLPAEKGGHVLDTIDWMYLTPNGNIMNRSQFRKFGIKVAELVATMRPVRNESRLAAE